VNIPAGATDEQIFMMGARAFQQHQNDLAAAYMQTAAELGNVRAEAALGLDYVNGTGEPKDPQRAIHWLSLAADRGHRVAEAQLGDMYEEANGVAQDLTRAFRYHLASAQQHWWQAEFRVGLEYELGYGTPHNRATAIEMLDRAVVDGHDGLSQQMSAMLRRNDTPARFRDLDDLLAHFSQLQAQAFRNATMPHFPPGKHCYEHSSTQAAYGGHYNAYYCD
jgi:TPR repeat protein